MKKILIAFVLMMPIVSLQSATRIVPEPSCFPCDDSNLTVTTKIVPEPSCFPCDDSN